MGSESMFPFSVNENNKIKHFYRAYLVLSTELCTCHLWTRLSLTWHYQVGTTISSLYGWKNRHRSSDNQPRSDDSHVRAGCSPCSGWRGIAHSCACTAVPDRKGHVEGPELNKGVGSDSGQACVPQPLCTANHAGTPPCLSSPLSTSEPTCEHRCTPLYS